MSLSYLIVAIFSPTPSLEHFVWPLSYCLLADICNHTWIPECGNEDDTGDKRLFIDECDMWEYNCDYVRKYVVTNYSECFGHFTGCPTLSNNFYRMGDYKFLREGRKIVYAPTLKHEHEVTHTHKPVIRTRLTTIPNLPRIMLHGRKRYTPEGTRRNRIHSRGMPTSTTNQMTTNYRRTVVLKKVTFMKNGKIMVRLVKGFAEDHVTGDSDFLQ